MKNKNFKPKSLIWAAFALGLAMLIHFYAWDYLFVQFWKYAALLSVVLNICEAFNIKVPYISDEKKLPKNYPVYAGVIAFILILSYLFFFNK